VPIRQLAAAASRVGEGDLAARSGVDTADEVGDLARRFDEMVQRLQANQRSLEQAHEMMVRTERLAVLGQVTSGVAHEIGNPLHAARQFVEALRDRPERADRYLALIDEALQRIDKVIGQMLGYSRERRLERRPTDLNEVVLRSADFVGYDQRSHDVEIDLQLGQGLPRIDVDPDAMGQVVVNLMVNALDAVGGQGRIEVRTDVIRNGAPRPTVLLRVSDDGPGISPETARHIFDPFFTTKDAGKGTGLGLSVSQELVSVQGGSIRLTSGEQGGASFEVRLPAMEDR
jgi:C4-dicarboxylate-specific signal transduction histidine kinase